MHCRAATLLILSTSVFSCTSEEIASDSTDADLDSSTQPDSASQDSANDDVAADTFAPDDVAEVSDIADVVAEPVPDSMIPTKTPSGVINLIPGVTTDKGLADKTALVRALIGFPLRNESALDTTLASLYDPTSATFRKYLTADGFVSAYAPLAVDVEKVKGWVESQGMAVPRVATNRLFIEITGTVDQFNKAFTTTLHVFERENPQAGNPPIEVYGVIGTLTVPEFVATRIVGVVAADLAADTKPLPAETGTVTTTPPSPVTDSLTPTNIAKAYGFDTLATKGFDGKGVKLGIVIGATFKKIDLQSFWKSFGITRADPTMVVTMEPIATRYVEGTLDTEWGAALAPGADVTIYQGPDSRNTSMVYTFNEAIAQAKVSVITDSFAHREDSEPAAVGSSYDRSAKMAAALGITVLAASGDSANPDIPSVSPYVTAVGGTVLTFAAGVPTDKAWAESGSGNSLRFPVPAFQKGLPIGTKRAVVDVAINAGGIGYWVYYLGDWKRYGGTSFSSPIFAAGVAAMNSYRASKGLPTIGWLNPILYRTTEVQKAFRDVVTGATASHSATAGWDYPTGFGAPNFDAIAQKLP